MSTQRPFVPSQWQEWNRSSLDNWRWGDGPFVTFSLDTFPELLPVLVCLLHFQIEQKWTVQVRTWSLRSSPLVPS